MAIEQIEQSLEFYDLEDATSLPTQLKLEIPPFRSTAQVFRQLNYLVDYICRPDISDGGADRSIAVEKHYIDRDFMEDHSVFYSRNLRPTPNHCQRVHFFVGPADDVHAELTSLAQAAYSLPPDDTVARVKYAENRDDFSRRRYLGFTVIRPLRGSPVGRTVLRILGPDINEDGSLRVMRCTREYRVHLMATELKVHGLAFQQQDVGVSACATIALWSALHRVRETEDIASATPAQITGLASKFRLPYGRSMPSEGLDVEQMCLAVQALGVSPYLSRVEKFPGARSLLYSATQSGMPAILIIELAPGAITKQTSSIGAGTPSAESTTEVKGPNEPIGRRAGSIAWHAVTVAGMKLKAQHELCSVVAEGQATGVIDDMSGDLKALYVHDDRIGPYLRAEVSEAMSGDTTLTIYPERHGAERRPEVWIVRKILIPQHAKIRITFADLRAIAIEDLIPQIQALVAQDMGVSDLNDLPKIAFSHWIEFGHRYVRRVLREHLLDGESAIEFSKVFAMPRYLAVVRLDSDKFGKMDILLDTTSPRKNLHFLGVVANDDGSEGKLRVQVAQYLAAKCHCPYYFEPE